MLAPIIIDPLVQFTALLAQFEKALAAWRNGTASFATVEQAQKRALDALQMASKLNAKIPYDVAKRWEAAWTAYAIEKQSPGTSVKTAGAGSALINLTADSYEVFGVRIPRTVVIGGVVALAIALLMRSLRSGGRR